MIEMYCPCLRQQCQRIVARGWLGNGDSLLFLLAGVTVGLRRQAFGSTEQTPVSTLCDEPLPALPSHEPVAPAV